MMSLTSTPSQNLPTPHFGMKFKGEQLFGSNSEQYRGTFEIENTQEGRAIRKATGIELQNLENPGDTFTLNAVNAIGNLPRLQIKANDQTKRLTPGQFFDLSLNILGLTHIQENTQETMVDRASLRFLGAFAAKMMLTTLGFPESVVLGQRDGSYQNPWSAATVDTLEQWGNDASKVFYPPGSLHIETDPSRT